MSSRKGKGRRGDPGYKSSANVHEPGSYEYTYNWMYPQATGESASQKSHVQSPGASFRTDKAPYKAFFYVLKAMKETHFGRALEYDGPPLGLSDARKELVDMVDVLEAMKRIGDAPAPFMGFRALLLHDHEKGVKARVKVSGGRSPKVRVKVKGPIPRADWGLLRKRLSKRFAVNL